MMGIVGEREKIDGGESYGERSVPRSSLSRPLVPEIHARSDLEQNFYMYKLSQI